MSWAIVFGFVVRGLQLQGQIRNTASLMTPGGRCFRGFSEQHPPPGFPPELNRTYQGPHPPSSTYPLYNIVTTLDPSSSTSFEVTSLLSKSLPSQRHQNVRDLKNSFHGNYWFGKFPVVPPIYSDRTGIRIRKTGCNLPCAWTRFENNDFSNGIPTGITSELLGQNRYPRMKSDY